MSRARLRVVSFDAAGTLIEVAEPVGATYARLAREEGFDVNPDAMETGFRRAFAAAPPLAPATPLPTHALDAFERGWWRDVVAGSLAHALHERSSDDAATAAHARAVERFFDAAFTHYASPAAWRLVDGAADVLATLHGRGFALAMISNFDRRLHGVLAGLGVADAFATVVASTECGTAKPEREPFDVARERLGGLPADACLHVGDSLRDDVAGALGAGWRAVWIDRAGAGDPALPAAATRITRLAALPDLPALAQSGTA